MKKQAINGAPKIERGIPVPERARRGKYAELFRSMQVGDSVLMDLKQATSIRTTFQRYAPMKFQTATVEGGIRIWRIE